MATPQSQQEASLQLKRTFAAPRDRVFRAWTDAKEFALWFHPTTDHTTIISELNLKVGGTYREIKPPEKLVFTWRWATDPVGQDSLVSVEFRDLGGSTEVSVSHDRFPDTETRDKHAEGWTGCLEQFQNYLA